MLFNVFLDFGSLFFLRAQKKKENFYQHLFCKMGSLIYPNPFKWLKGRIG